MIQPSALGDSQTTQTRSPPSTFGTLPYDVIIHIVQCGGIDAADAIALRQVRRRELHPIWSLTD